VAAAGVGAGAVVGFQRIHGATATEPNSAVESEPRDTARLRAAQLPTAPLPPAPPFLEAPASATETLSVVSPIVPAALPAADSASPASPERRPILVQVDPPAAAVTVDGQRLGTDLVNVELATGEHKRATIALRGYRTRVVELDSSADFVQVTLVPTSRAKARSQQAAESGVDAATVDATTEPVAAAASPSSSDRQNRSPAPTSSEADAAYPQ
jgi:hypothetical protein